MFGILKKRWKILKYGIRFDDIEVVEMIFVVCCILHNMMLSEMDTNDNFVTVGRGRPIAGDAIWLGVINEGVPPRCVTNDDKAQAVLWGKRRQLLAEHVEFVSRQSKHSH